MIKNLKKTISVMLIMCCAITASTVFTIEDVHAINKNICSKSYKSGPYYEALCNVKVTGDQRKDIVNIALSQAGYLESNSTSKLSGTSQGSKKYTEYSRWFGDQGAGWCAIFVAWCANQASVSTSVIPQKGNPGNLTKSWKKYTAYADLKPGDIIFVNSGNNGHAGIITRIDSNYIYTVEGNMSKRVRDDVKYSRATGKIGWNSNTAKILRYFSPKYKVTTNTPKSYTVNINGNKGTVNQPTLRISKGDLCKVSKDVVARLDYELVGWNLYRSSDKKWYVSNRGWYTTKELTKKKYKKTKFAVNFSKKLDDSWTKGTQSATPQFTLYAVWGKL